MKPYFQEDGITIYHGDCREILPQLPRSNAVITDPVWPGASADICGRDDPFHLAEDIFGMLPGRTERLVVQLGFDSDPRFLQSVPPDLPFIRACWLDCARPHYKGFLLAGVDIAYVFGSVPKRDGWTLLPGMCRSNDAGGQEPGHPCPRKLQHVRWLCRYYAQGLTIDPFMGSGTTAVACRSLQIPFIGIEIEERFCEVAVKRLSQAVLPLEAA